jgi:hypothetical protein
VGSVYLLASVSVRPRARCWEASWPTSAGLLIPFWVAVVAVALKVVPSWRQLCDVEPVSVG